VRSIDCNSEYSKELNKHLKKWEIVLLRASYLFNSSKKCKNDDGTILEIDIEKIEEVLHSTLDDLFLIAHRYKIYKDEFKGVDKFKVAGTFTYHFMRILPINGNRECNAKTVLTILSLIAEDKESKKRVLPIELDNILINEFLYYLTDRAYSSENLYLFFKALYKI